MNRVTVLAVGMVMAVVLGACAGGSSAPASPSALPSTGSTTISGTAVIAGATAVSGDRTGSSTPSFGALDRPNALRVCVVGRDLCVEVGESNTFALHGDLAGNVDLHFTGPGQDVRVTVNDVQSGQTVIVSVSLNGDRGSLQVESREGGAAGPKVVLCHLTGNGTYRRVEVDQHAEAAHRGHGDAAPGEPVPDTDPEILFAEDCGIAGPAVDIEKSTNGEDADRGSGPRLPAGSTVTWTYLVTNTGNVALDMIAVTDSEEGAISCPAATLDPGVSMTCTLDGTAIAGRYSNLGTVTANADGVTVTDTDRSRYLGKMEEDDDGEDTGARVEVCHRSGNDRYRLIEVSVDAEAAHIAHGDGHPGDGTFDDTCAVLPAG